LSVSDAIERTACQGRQLTVAWGFVGVPLAWGVLQTLTNALKLFQ